MVKLSIISAIPFHTLILLNFHDFFPVPIRAIFIEVEKDLNKHLNVFRMLSKHTENKDKRYIDDRVLNMHYSSYENTPPLLSHGFSRIDTIQFVPMKYQDKDTNDLFAKYLF